MLSLGLLLPIPPVAIDILIAVALIFTAMLVFVALTAREPAEITSVPLVVIFVTLLRLGTAVAAVKSIVTTAQAGMIIGWCQMYVYYGLASLAGTIALIILLCALTCAAAIFIRRKATGHVVDTIPVRQMTLQTEFDVGAITYDQMLRAKHRIGRQERFFSGMAGMSFLLLFDSIGLLVIALTAVGGSLAIGILRPLMTTGELQEYRALAMALSLITVFPAALMAFSLSVLINKRFLIVLKVKSPIMQDAVVTATAFEEEIAAVNDSDAAATAAAASDGAQEILQNNWQPELVEDTTIAESVEQTEAAEPKINESTNGEIQSHIALSEPVRNEDYYDAILALTGTKEKATILLAGRNISELPVTVAIELMTRIIRKGKKSLLIDIDPSRNAVARTFDIDTASMQGKAARTGIENLYVCPADDPENPAAVALSRKLSRALKVFDYIVIYAPNAAAEGIQEQLVGVSDAAVIFGASEDLEKLNEKLTGSGCQVLHEKHFAAPI